MQPTSYTRNAKGIDLAYRHHPGREPGVLFLPGFKSDMHGSKATALWQWCEQQGMACTLCDYSGHGMSGGVFEDGCITDWLADAVTVWQETGAGACIIVGSSMGGWLALLLARNHPEAAHAVVTLAAAPDFTEKLMWDVASEDQRAELMANGRYAIANCYEDQAPYIITRKLIEDGRNHLLLQGSIAVRCPIRMLHGTADADVPWQFSAQALQQVESADARLTLLKDGDHRLSTPEHLALLCAVVGELIA